MSSAPPVSHAPIPLIRARLARLATSPRVRLLPEAPEILRELLELLDQVEAHDRRLAGLERAVGSLLPPVTESCDEC